MAVSLPCRKRAQQLRASSVLFFREPCPRSAFIIRSLGHVSIESCDQGLQLHGRAPFQQLTRLDDRSRAPMPEDVIDQDLPLPTRKSHRREPIERLRVRSLYWYVDPVGRGQWRRLRWRAAWRGTGGGRRSVRAPGGRRQRRGSRPSGSWGWCLTCTIDATGARGRLHMSIRGRAELPPSDCQNLWLRLYS